MKVAVHQPQYLPWLGYFDKMDQADVFVLLDDVQFKKNEWQNRNKIRNAEGWQYLTVPVLNEFGQDIKDIEIDNSQSWRAKHLKSIEINYSRAPYSKEYFPFFDEVFTRDWTHLAEINTCFIYHLKETLGIKTEIVKSSSMDLEGASTEKLIDICRKLDADTYISGAGGRDYLETEKFAESGIKLEFQGFTHPEYKQVFVGFHPFMSAIDLLFCSGKKSLDIIKEGRKQ